MFSNPNAKTPSSMLATISVKTTAAWFKGMSPLVIKAPLLWSCSSISSHPGKSCTSHCCGLTPRDPVPSQSFSPSWPVNGAGFFEEHDGPQVFPPNEDATSTAEAVNPMFTSCSAISPGSGTTSPPDLASSDETLSFSLSSRKVAASSRNQDGRRPLCPPSKTRRTDSAAHASCSSWVWCGSTKWSSCATPKKAGHLAFGALRRGLNSFGSKFARSSTSLRMRSKPTFKR
mmetsp:Transcript_41697/g.110355  ORF Transcript_41697/g.110355 Transcript_41697/m.110355 type:complete len:230 (-) Transcript_41697:634-1323(-)